MSKPTDFWQRCPVCRARLKDSSQCPRCRLDFSPMLNAADQARNLADTARYQLKLGLRREAFWDAVRAVQIRRTPETLQSLAITALAKGHFELAMAVWRELRTWPDHGANTVHDP